MRRFIYKSIIILCEGKSEHAYIQKLSKFFHSQENNKIIFVPKTIGGCTKVNDELRKSKQRDPKITHVIWLDADVYKRGERDLPKKLRDELLLNKFSFEDFLVMHLDRDAVMKWQDICKGLNHFTKPITSKICKKEIVKIFSEYKKGAQPDELELSEKSLENLFSNQEDKSILFYSDFIDFMRKQLEAF